MYMRNIGDIIPKWGDIRIADIPKLDNIAFNKKMEVK